MAYRGRYRSAGTEDTDAGHTPCARGMRCEERDYQGNANLCPRAFCETDTRYVRWAITGLPMTYVEVRALLASSGQAGERVSGSREPPIPLAADVQAFMREIVHVACSWEEAVRRQARLADPPAQPRRDSVKLACACKTLAGRYAGGEFTGGNFDVLLNLPPEAMRREITRKRVEEIIAEEGDAIDPGRIIWDTSGQAWEVTSLDGVQAALEFLALSGRARGMLGLSRQRRRITEVRCDLCKEKTLVQYEAHDGGWEPKVRCTGCPNAYIGPAYDLLMGRVYAEQLKALARQGGGTLVTR